MVDLTLLTSVDTVATLVTTPVELIFDLTDAGPDHLERCLACWPQAHVYTVRSVEASSKVSCIAGPRFAATSDWGAAPLAEHGVLADIARRRAQAPATARTSTTTLDEYVLLEGLAPISLLLLSATLAAVELLLGASSLLASKRVHAVLLLAPASGGPTEAILTLLAGVLGKFDFAWAIVDAGPVSLAVRYDPAPSRPRGWVDQARLLDVPVTGVIHVGTHTTAEPLARSADESVPLYLIDADLPSLERYREELGAVQNVTCIGAAVSDDERMLTLHIDARGRGSYFATPDAYYRAHPQDGVRQFIEVTTCTLNALAEKYPLTAANVLVLELADGIFAALRGATTVLAHLDFVTLPGSRALVQSAERDAIDTHLSRQGFYQVPVQYVGGDPAESLLYVRKQRLWNADPLAMIRRVTQQANVSLCSLGWCGSAAEAALYTSPCLQDQIVFCNLQLVAHESPGSADIDVLMSSHEGLPAFFALLKSASSSFRLCAIVVSQILTKSEVESATRVAFDHGFLLHRESATAATRVFLRSSVIRDPAGWLAINNAFGRREFRFSALGQLGRFGNQLFQIMHLLLSSLRHNARASTCVWPHNEFFQFGFLETAAQGCTWTIAPEMWQIMAVWALEELPDDVDYRAHLQWIAPFLSRHAAFINRCFDLKPEWIPHARRMVESLTAGAGPFTAFHVRRTDYLTSEVQGNPWHQEIPIAWYRQALETQRNSRIYAASDDLEYVEQALPGVALVTHRHLVGCELPPLLIDHCAMRAADTLLMVNSTFSRTAGLLAASTQKAMLPSLRERAFARYLPWHDPIFWSRFEERYFTNPQQHADAVERWLAAVGVPQLEAHEKPSSGV